MPAFTCTVVHLSSQQVCECAVWFSAELRPVPWTAHVLWLDQWLEFEGVIDEGGMPAFMYEDFVRRKLAENVQTLSCKKNLST